MKKNLVFRKIKISLLLVCSIFFSLVILGNWRPVDLDWLELERFRRKLARPWPLWGYTTRIFRPIDSSVHKLHLDRIMLHGCYARLDHSRADPARFSEATRSSLLIMHGGPARILCTVVIRVEPIGLDSGRAQASYRGLPTRRFWQILVKNHCR